MDGQKVSELFKKYIPKRLSADGIIYLILSHNKMMEDIEKERKEYKKANE